jgi:hypothetical protein
MARLRTAWVTQAAVGWAVAPRMRMRRVACSMTARTYALAGQGRGFEEVGGEPPVPTAAGALLELGRSEDQYVAVIAQARAYGVRHLHAAVPAVRRDDRKIDVAGRAGFASCDRPEQTRQLGRRIRRQR